MSKTVIIPCAGAGSRLSDVTYDQVPKILLRATRSTTILEEIVATFANHEVVDFVFVVSSERHRHMIHTYLRSMDTAGLSFRFVIHPKRDGSLSAIRSALHSYPQIVETGFFACWSDIIPEKIGKPGYHVSTVYHDSEKTDCRWCIKHGKLVNEPGGVLGLYHVCPEDASYIFEGHGTGAMDDLVQVLAEMPLNVRETKCLDLGDLAKYVEHHKHAEPKLGRFFNDITIEDGVVTKTAIGYTGLDRMRGEADFYLGAPTNLRDLYPQMLKTPVVGRLVMEDLRVKGFTTVYDAWNRGDDEDRERIYNAVRAAFAKHHKVRQTNATPKEYVQEYFTKTVDRIRQFEVFYNLDGEFWNEMAQAREYHVSVLPTTFHTIHGDPNAENVMINPETLEVRFIDPKNNFGGLAWYGDADYDHAKFIYGLFLFNSLDSDCRDAGNIDYGSSLDRLWAVGIDSMMVHINKYYPAAKRKKLLTIIAMVTLSLPPFVKQDVIKMQVAAELGKKLLKTANFIEEA